MPAVVAAILRMGIGGTDVDNASRGGLSVGVGISTGRLFPPAKQHMAFGGRVFEAHPGSGIRFDEVVLPHFERLLDASLMAARHVPHELAGWDFAIGPAGPVLIEGNTRPNLRFVEIATGGRCPACASTKNRNRRQRQGVEWQVVWGQRAAVPQPTRSWCSQAEPARRLRPIVL